MLRSAVALALVLVITSCASPPPVPVRHETSISSDLAHATFDSVWTIIHRTHFDPEFGGVDWTAVRDTLRPRVADVTSNEELRRILSTMIDEIGLSHFGILAGSALDVFGEDLQERGGNGDPGVVLRLIGDDPVVWRVRANSAAARAGVRPGWIVRDVDGIDLGERIERAREVVEEDQLQLLIAQVTPRWLNGVPGSTTKITFVDGDDAARVLALEREVPDGVMNRFGNLPPIRTEVADSLAHFEGRSIGVIGFNIWLMPVAAPFDAAVDAYRDADGMVVDLRGNLGGIGAMSMGLAGHFMTERKSLGVMSTRTSDLEFRANPRLSNAKGERVEPFAGPLAILVDELSMSTSEIFAQGLKVLGRARIFGRPTPGAALPSMITELPNGDGLQHAFADFVDPEGNRLEKRGVLPDEVVPLDRADLLAGRDAPLEAAFRWIAASADESSARR